MSNFLIAYPQNNNCVNLSYPAESNNYYYYNLIGGPRSAQYKTSSSLSATFQYEFNDAITIDSLCVIDISEVINPNFSSTSNAVVLTIDSSSDGSTWTNRETTSEIVRKLFYPPTYNDYVVKFTSASAKYWRVKIEAYWAGNPVNSEFKISKLFLCEAIDLGREPSSISHAHINKELLYSLDGNLIKNSNFRNSNIIDLEFRGITDANLTKFLNALDVNSRGYMALFNVSSNIQLLGVQCVYGWASNITHYQIVDDYNFLSFTFNERF